MQLVQILECSKHFFLNWIVGSRKLFLSCLLQTLALETALYTQLTTDNQAAKCACRKQHDSLFGKNVFTMYMSQRDVS